MLDPFVMMEVLVEFTVEDRFKDPLCETSEVLGGLGDLSWSSYIDLDALTLKLESSVGEIFPFGMTEQLIFSEI